MRDAGAVGEALERARELAWSQGSVSAALAGALVVAVVLSWWIWSSRALRALWSIPVRVLVTGSRGKSSTVRLLHAALLAGGIPTIAKVTGTGSRELGTDGTEYITRRVGQVSVLEVLEAVDRTSKRNGPTPQAVVLECMAVSPDLIEFLASRIVHPTEVILMNALWDHLEEEGSSLEDIAGSMARAFPGATLAVTAEPRDSTVAAISWAAHRADVPLERVDGHSLTTQERAGIPHSHPANVAAALAICAAHGIPRSVALSGMAQATHEPGDGAVAHRIVHGTSITYVDAGAVNDTDSLENALVNARASAPPGAVTIALLTARWDRPLRAMQFAGALAPSGLDGIDGIVTLGQLDVLVRKALLRSGWPVDRIRHLGPIDVWRWLLLRRLLRFARALRGERPSAVHLIALENVHQGVADALRGAFRSTP